MLAIMSEVTYRYSQEGERVSLSHFEQRREESKEGGGTLERRGLDGRTGYSGHDDGIWDVQMYDHIEWASLSHIVSDTVLITRLREASTFRTYLFVQYRVQELTLVQCPWEAVDNPALEHSSTPFRTRIELLGRNRPSLVTCQARS